MNRNGSALLTGTLIVSLWLAPAGRLHRDAVEAQIGSNAAPNREGAPSGGGHRRTAGEGEHHLDRAQQEEIKKEAEEVFGNSIQRLITHTCETRDYQIQKKTEEEKQQALVEQEWQDDKNSSEKCLDPRNFIIALVPDPLRTHLALVFDRTIDVLEEGAQDE